MNPDNEPFELPTANTEEPLPLSEFWRELVNRNMDFDPDKHFEDMLLLNLRVDNQKWREVSASEQTTATKQGDLSLLEKYGKEK